MLFVFVEKKGPAFLPMLSDTFVPEPGNYISRVTLSATSLIVAALGFVPSAAESGGSGGGGGGTLGHASGRRKYEYDWLRKEWREV